MAINQFNGATVSWGTVLSGAGMTSFSIDAGNRAEVDVTLSTDSARKSIPGFASVPTVTVGVLFDNQVDLTDLVGCKDSAGLTINTNDTDCSASTLFQEGAWLMGWNVTAQMDDVVAADLTFMIDRDYVAPDPE